MTDIYQMIWDADQTHNGIEPVSNASEGDPARGYVVVDPAFETRDDPKFRLMPKVVIPESKAKTYNLCRRLFNNYALPEAAEEVDTPEERAERHDFMEAILDTPPMAVAREYVASRTRTAISPERWYNTVMDQWFRRFEQAGDPHLSGFEHVVVGEQEGGKVQGYHFWYKYHLDDGFAHTFEKPGQSIAGLSPDRIFYHGSKTTGAEQVRFPESVTIEFGWNAPDYDAGKVRPLHKKIGGFFVGCSVEGLMALGTVRAHAGARAPQTAVIEGARYDMRLFAAENRRHIRTFYPVFLGPVSDPVTNTGDPLPGATLGEVRILCALVNPQGHDPGQERITLVNVGTAPVDTTGWTLRDPGGRSEPVTTGTLAPGAPVTQHLSGGGVQLSNKGARIELLRDNGAVVHAVRYARAQVRHQNATVIFNDC